MLPVGNYGGRTRGIVKANSNAPIQSLSNTISSRFAKVAQYEKKTLRCWSSLWYYSVVIPVFRILPKCRLSRCDQRRTFYEMLVKQLRQGQQLLTRNGEYHSIQRGRYEANKKTSILEWRGSENATAGVRL